MREIKFRAWDEQTKKMHDQIIIDFTGLEYSWIPSEEKGDSWRTKDLMQYTGLKDKNGKEIYEGDIMEISDCALGVIEYRNAHFALFSQNTDMPYPFGDSHMVIGNIYENQDLLK